MPVETQEELITLETTIHQRVEGFEAHMTRMGIMQILIKIGFDKTKDLGYNKKCPNK